MGAQIIDLRNGRLVHALFVPIRDRVEESE